MRLPKFIWKIVGALLLLSYFTPIPFGTIRLALGLSILVCASLPFALFVQGCRRRFGWLNRALIWVEDKLGDRWAGNLKVTRLENDPRAHFLGKAESDDSQSQLEKIRATGTGHQDEKDEY